MGVTALEGVGPSAPRNPKGPMEGWKDGRMGEWKDGRMEGWKDGRMEEWKDGRVEGWKDGRMEGWKDGRMEGWKDGSAAPSAIGVPGTEERVCLTASLGGGFVLVRQ